MLRKASSSRSIRRVTWLRKNHSSSWNGPYLGKFLVRYSNGFEHPIHLYHEPEVDAVPISDMAQGSEIICLLWCLQTRAGLPSRQVRASLVLRRLRSDARIYENIRLLLEPGNGFDETRSGMTDLRNIEVLYPTESTVVEIV